MQQELQHLLVSGKLNSVKKLSKNEFLECRFESSARFGNPKHGIQSELTNQQPHLERIDSKANQRGEKPRQSHAVGQRHRTSPGQPTHHRTSVYTEMRRRTQSTRRLLFPSEEGQGTFRNCSVSSAPDIAPKGLQKPLGRSPPRPRGRGPSVSICQLLGE